MCKEDFLGYLKSSRITSVLGINVLFYVLYLHLNLKFDHTFFLLQLYFLFTGVATMWQNDYDDRFRDSSQGRFFGFDHADGLKYLAQTAWVVALALCAIVYFINATIGWISIAGWLGCRLYSPSMKVPFLSMIVVGAMDIVPFAFVYVLGGYLPLTLRWALVAFFSMMLMRETIKDMYDACIDAIEEHKRTVPALFGYKAGYVFIGIAACFSIFGLYKLSGVGFLFPSFFVVLSFVLTVLYFSLRNGELTTWARLLKKFPKRTLDVAVLFMMLSLV